MLLLLLGLSLLLLREQLPAAFALCLLGSLVLLRSRRDFFFASAFIILGSGLLVWLLARPGMHLGARGWVFGLFCLVGIVLGLKLRPLLPE